MNDFVKRISFLSQKQLIVLAARLQEKLEMQAQTASKVKEEPEKKKNSTELGKQFVVHWQEVSPEATTSSEVKPWLIIAWDDAEAALWVQTLRAKEQPFDIITAESLGLTQPALSEPALESILQKLSTTINAKTNDDGAIVHLPESTIPE